MTDKSKTPVKTKTPRYFAGPTAKRLKDNGYNMNAVLETLDGDDIKVHTIDAGHPYPVVGEVFDWNGGSSWLARWNEAGQYEGTHEAASKHSMRKNMVEYAPLKNARIDNVLGTEMPASMSGIVNDAKTREVGTIGHHWGNSAGLLQAIERMHRKIGSSPKMIVLGPPDGNDALRHMFDPMLKNKVLGERVLDLLGSRLPAADPEKEFAEGFKEATGTAEEDKRVEATKEKLVFWQAGKEASQQGYGLAAWIALARQFRGFYANGRIEITQKQAGDLPLDGMRYFVSLLEGDPDVSVQVDAIEVIDPLDGLTPEVARGVRFGDQDAAQDFGPHTVKVTR